MKVLAVVPARMGSTRFPGKPLADLAGLPLVVRVVRAVLQAATVEDVVVATDSARIREVVQAHGGACVLTRADHPSGTDRVAEVAQAHDHELVLNVQGDEPLVSPHALDALVLGLSARPDCDLATLAHPIRDRARLASPHQVTVGVDAEDVASYFTRAAVPPPALGHVGVYLFRRSFLLGWPSLPPSEGERREHLEQLRALDAGARILVVSTPHDSPGVDTPQDLARAAQRLADREGTLWD